MNKDFYTAGNDVALALEELHRFALTTNLSMESRLPWLRWAVDENHANRVLSAEGFVGEVFKRLKEIVMAVLKSFAMIFKAIFGIKGSGSGGDTSNVSAAVDVEIAKAPSLGRVEGVDKKSLKEAIVEKFGQPDASNAHFLMDPSKTVAALSSSFSKALPGYKEAIDSVVNDYKNTKQKGFLMFKKEAKVLSPESQAKVDALAKVTEEITKAAGAKIFDDGSAPVPADWANKLETHMVDNPGKHFNDLYASANAFLDLGDDMSVFFHDRVKGYCKFFEGEAKELDKQISSGSDTEEAYKVAKGRLQAVTTCLNFMGSCVKILNSILATAAGFFGVTAKYAEIMESNAMPSDKSDKTHPWKPVIASTKKTVVNINNARERNTNAMRAIKGK